MKQPQKSKTSQVKNKKNQSAVLVIGMHRSGTSAVTRGLITLGVELGEHLVSAAEDNPTGFWEDKEVQTLNECILQDLGHRWDSLRPISEESLTGKPMQARIKEAKALIRNHFGRMDFWGMKDPRITRLLPFWIPVLKELKIKTHVILVLRHPASIARSLEVRNGFEDEKSVLLCTNHWLAGLKAISPARLIAVDYDDWLEHPDRNLARLARRLEISVTAKIKKDIKDYSKNFLSRSLRHDKATQKINKNWKKKGGFFALALELYSELLKLTQKPATRRARKWEVYFKEFEKLQPLLAYADSLMDAGRGPADDLEAQVGLRDQEILRLNQVVADSSDQLRKLSGQITTHVEAEKYEKEIISALEQRVSALKDKEAELAKDLQKSRGGGIKQVKRLQVYKDRESKLNQQILVVKARLAQRNQEVDELQANEPQQRNEWRGKLELRDQEILRLNQVVEDASEKLRELYEQVAFHVEEGEDKESRIAPLQELVETYRDQEAQLAQEREEFQTEWVRKQEAWKEKEARLAQEREESQTEWAGKQEAWKDQEAQLAQELEAVQTKESELSEELEAVRAVESRLKREWQTFKEKNTQLAQELADAQEKKSHLSKDLETAETKKAQLEQELEYRIGLRDQEIARLNSLVTLTAAQSQEATRQLSQSLKQIAKKDRKLVQLAQQLGASQAKESQFVRTLETVRTRENHLAQRLEVSQTKETEWQDKLKKSVEREVQFSNELEDSRQNESELDAQLQEGQGREAQLAQDLKNTDALKNDLAEMLEQTQQHYQSLSAHEAELRKILDRESYTVFKPLARRLYRRCLIMAAHMPEGIQSWLKGMKNQIMPGPKLLQIPSWQAPPEGSVEVPEPSATAEPVAMVEAPAEPSAPLNLPVTCEAQGFDVIVFPVIDWHFRVQRPQHIAKGLSQLGHRVFYLSTTFGDLPPGGRVIEQIDERIFVGQLDFPGPHPIIYEQMPGKEQVQMLNEALDRFRQSLGIHQVVTIVDHPFWRPIARAIPGALMVYDCMDDHGGFSNNTKAILEAEDHLMQESDLVITTSALLSEKVGKKRENTLIRNAAESAWFAEPPEKLSWHSDRPVVGYFGAISEWFDIDLVTQAAEAYPEYDFVLVGSTYMCNTQKAEQMENIHFIGEVPYATLKEYLYAFDVCLIPFKLIELIQCTNPVKLYEYLAAGKPVVSTDIPEVRRVQEQAYVSRTAQEFIANIQKAMTAKDDPKAVARRKAFAMENQWINRVEHLQEKIAETCPRVSVVVLTYNNLEFTQACLHSLEKHTHYSNWELIIVDNASSDGSPEYLREYAEGRERVKLFLNDENLGFAAGNNVGIREADGEYVIVLNNDTYVTDGWMGDLIRHFRQDESLGLVGPVTNNIGNEARIEIDYANMEEMAEASLKYKRDQIHRRFYVNTAAFFCIAIKRAVIEAVGLLDEAFGRGFFEDDDYCIRVRNAGYKAAIADDVFIHHHLSASFDQLADSEKQKLFEANKAIFEEKWGPWQPHEYRKVESETV